MARLAVGDDEKKKLMFLGGLLVAIVVVIVVLYLPKGKKTATPAPAPAAPATPATLTTPPAPAASAAPHLGKHRSTGGVGPVTGDRFPALKDRGPYASNRAADGPRSSIQAGCRVGKSGRMWANCEGLAAGSRVWPTITGLRAGPGSPGGCRGGRWPALGR